MNVVYKDHWIHKINDHFKIDTLFLLIISVSKARLCITKTRLGWRLTIPLVTSSCTPTSTSAASRTTIHTSSSTSPRPLWLHGLMTTAMEVILLTSVNTEYNLATISRQFFTGSLSNKVITAKYLKPETQHYLLKIHVNTCTYIVQ